MPEGVVAGEGLKLLNNAGQVAVEIDGGGPQKQAGRWSFGEGKTRPIGTSSTTDLAFQACGINEAGDVIGSMSEGHDPFNNAFLWSPEKGMDELMRRSAAYFHATAINNRRQVVGCLNYKAFLSDGDSGFRELGHPEQGETFPLAINGEGWIVGFWNAGKPRPVLWKPDLKMVELETFRGSLGFAQAINDRGVVLVNFMGTTHGSFLWTEEAGYSALPVPLACEGVSGVAINNRGEVLLNNAMSRNSAPRAFLFSGGTLKELPPPPRSGPAIYTYTGLNDLGWLVGLKGEKERDPTSGQAASRRGFLARPFK